MRLKRSIFFIYRVTSPVLHIKNHWEDVKETKDCHSHDAELVVQKWPVNFDQLVSYMCTFQG